MVTKKCICGNYFLPNTKRSIYCYLCTCNSTRVRRFKTLKYARRYKKYHESFLRAKKMYRLRKGEELIGKWKEYRLENLEWHKETTKQYYIKNNL